MEVDYIPLVPEQFSSSPLREKWRYYFLAAYHQTKNNAEAIRMATGAMEGFRLQQEREDKSGTRRIIKESLVTSLKGGAGSGNFGHAGRPGRIGGSASTGVMRGEETGGTPGETLRTLLKHSHYEEVEGELNMGNSGRIFMAGVYIPQMDAVVSSQSTNGDWSINHEGMVTDLVSTFGDTLFGEGTQNAYEKGLRKARRIARDYKRKTGMNSFEAWNYHTEQTYELLKKAGLVNIRVEGAVRGVNIIFTAASLDKKLLRTAQQILARSKFPKNSQVTLQVYTEHLEHKPGESWASQMVVASPAEVMVSNGLSFRDGVASLKQYATTNKGGHGSGNFGHAGRPGHVGGSSPKGGINRGVPALSEKSARVARALGLPEDISEILQVFGSPPLSGDWEAERDWKWHGYDIMYQRFAESFADADVLSITLKDIEELQVEYLAQRDVLGQSLENEKERRLVDDAIYGSVCVFDQFHAMEVGKRVCSGEITPEEGEERNWNIPYETGSNANEFLDSPAELYHVTTSSDGIIQNGFRSRMELGWFSAKGLGGGSETTISFTSSENVATNIERAMHEAWGVLNRRITLADMVSVATTGAGADHPFLDLWAGYWGTGTRKGEVPFPLRKMMDEESHWDNLSSEEQDKLTESIFQEYKKFSTFREHAGGVADPLFFGTNWRGLRAISPKQIKTMRVKSKKGSKMVCLDPREKVLAEWRVFGNRWVESMEAVDYYDEDTSKDVLMGIQPRTVKERIENSLVSSIKGGAGSGNYGHAGRPGHVGGSAPQGQRAPALGRSGEKAQLIHSVLKQVLSEEARERVAAITETITQDEKVIDIHTRMTGISERLSQLAKEVEKLTSIPYQARTTDDSERLTRLNNMAVIVRSEFNECEIEMIHRMSELIAAENGIETPPPQAKISFSRSASFRKNSLLVQPEQEQAIRETLTELCNAGIVPIQKVFVSWENLGGGSYYSHEDGKIHMGFDLAGGEGYGETRQTFIHEMGHLLENSGRGYPIFDLNGEYRGKRIRYSLQRDGYINETKWGREYFPDVGFVTPYMGRYYQFDGGTEIFSVGLEQMFVNPIGFNESDPTSFHYILGHLVTTLGKTK